LRIAKRREARAFMIPERVERSKQLSQGPIGLAITDQSSEDR
jgi:hypothetical protein